MERFRKLWRGRTMTFGVPLLVSGAVGEGVEARGVRQGGEKVLCGYGVLCQKSGEKYPISVSGRYGRGGYAGSS